MRDEVDVNCDMGEAVEGNHDAEFMRYISSCSLSCGLHAGTADVIRQTAEHAVANGVTMGAHPSYPDREHFGRRSMEIEPAALADTLTEQIASLSDLVRESGGRLAYVKPHGSLYNDMCGNAELAAVVLDAVLQSGAPNAVYGRSGSIVAGLSAERGIRFVDEVFADRAYGPNLELLPRTEPGSVLVDVGAVRGQVEGFVAHGVVEASDGVDRELTVDSICIHSDSPGALEAARLVHEYLQAQDVRLAPVS